MKRQLVYGTLLLVACVAASVCLVLLSGCNTLANLHIMNPSYSLRSVTPHLNAGIPPSVDLDFVVNVYNPNRVVLRLDSIDFDLFVNNDPVMHNVHSVQAFQIPPRADSDVHLATHLTYDSIRAIYNEVLSMIQGNRATVGIQGNAYYDTPIGQLRFPVNVASR
ncbi:MAG TPA: LEA type 2 family protein [Thermoanaerobaculia bacterium]|nr:LEA type 2 family protein [Thermoanaerobaculia bacterium]